VIRRPFESCVQEKSIFLILLLNVPHFCSHTLWLPICLLGFRPLGKNPVRVIIIINIIIKNLFLFVQPFNWLVESLFPLKNINNNLLLDQPFQAAPNFVKMLEWPKWLKNLLSSITVNYQKMVGKVVLGIMLQPILLWSKKLIPAENYSSSKGGCHYPLYKSSPTG